MGYNHYTPAEFVKLPVSQRIELVMEHRVEFLDEHGKTIPPFDAVDQLPAPPSPVATKR